MLLRGLQAAPGTQSASRRFLRRTAAPRLVAALASFYEVGSSAGGQNGFDERLALGGSGAQQPTHHVHVVTADAAMPTFELMSEQQAYGRYLSVYDRKVKITCQQTEQVQELHYDVVGHPRCNFMSVTVLPFHPGGNEQEPQFTLIREFCQGPGRVCYNVPSGGFDPKKHASLEECAQAELSEEALLRGGRLVQLAPPGHAGFYEVKWCANRFMPFLVINPEVDPSPGDRDVEEHIQVVRVGLGKLKQLAEEGELMLPSMMTVKLALEHLAAAGTL